MKTSTAIVSAALFFGSLSWAPATVLDSESARVVTMGCRVFIDKSVGKSIEDQIGRHWYGACWGHLETLLVVGPDLNEPKRYCPPDAIKLPTAAKALVQYVDGHSSELDDHFVLVGMKAFREAWPCSSRH